MHFYDLTPYTYSPGEPNKLNVGWLDSSSPFPRGKVDPAIVEKLGKLVSKPTNGTRGVHNCPFCPQTTKFGGHRCTVDGKELWLGSAEIHVTAEDGKVYASPDMIYHYVTDHEYFPPQEFLDAVAAS